MKNIVWILHLHLWFNQNLWSDAFLYAKKIKILYSTIRLICITVAAFWRISTGHKLRMLLHHKDMLFSFKSKRKERRRRIRVVRLIYAICVQWILSKMVLWWRRWDELLNKVVIFIFFAYKKVFSSLHKGPWQCYLLGSQRDSHKPPGFHPKYLKLCSEQNGGKWLMTKFSFWGRVTC